MANLQGYVHWLQSQQVAPELLQAHREAVDLLAPHVPAGPMLPRHLEAALRQEERAGAPARRLANLQIVGEAVLRWQREQHAAIDAAGPRPARGTPAPPLATTTPAPARPPCECRTAQPLYLEEPPSWLRSVGALTGLGSLGLIAVLGVWGSTTVSLVLGACGFLAAALVTEWRCVGCRQAVRGAALDQAQRQAAGRRRLLCLGATIALVASAAMAGQRWRAEMAAERELMEAQQRLHEMFDE